jgi:heme/copper-type cytochrome/quinol oxidase subunit 3
MEAFQHPALWPSSAYGTVLFTLTGVHATHVLTGVLALLFVYFRTRNADSVAQNQWAVEGAVKWWHFVDVAWVFIYPVLYLVG